MVETDAPELEAIEVEAHDSWILKHPVWCGLFAVVLIVIAVGIYQYVKFAQTISERLRNEPQGSVAVYYAAPRKLFVGDNLGADELIASLRGAGYAPAPNTTTGYYTAGQNSVEVHPSPAYAADPARLTFQAGRIARIASVRDGNSLASYALEPLAFASAEGANRERRANLSFDDIPPRLREAILSAEDKHFFQHAGFDPTRIAKAIYVNWKSGHKDQGGSTLTMQLARNLWLDRNKTWRRKSMESLITVVLEQKLSKRQIFELYCNKIYLGRHADYSIFGFATAARTYFDKNVGDLTLPEAALLAGMAQRPTYFDPIRNPDNAVSRRNTVLTMMRQNKYIDDAELADAREAPLQVRPRVLDADGAPYFLSLVNDDLQAKLGDDAAALAGSRIYTTLDQDLQNDAREAVDAGMKTVLAELKTRRKQQAGGVLPQVALIALDPHTGEVKAVIGGRDYAQSQLNHILAKRQPGSIFKPFVYAAALQGALSGFQDPVTLATTVDDEPTTFRFGRQHYTPGNFGQRFYGTVTLRQALAHSMNVATVKVAEKIGYEQVVRLARNAGLNDDIRPTPAVALGAYEATPLEMAGAYTVFANQGAYIKPSFLTSVALRDRTMDAMPDRETRQVLDPRTTFLMLDLLREVVKSGTAARVGSMGLKLPVAGKTGTSRDGWFAGFSSGLLCIVWVGYDDNRELGLEGARSALPVWVEFMKRAARHPEYFQPFSGMPSGVASVAIDPTTGLTAGADCPAKRNEYFLEGTEPAACEVHAHQAEQMADSVMEHLETPPTPPL